MMTHLLTELFAATLGDLNLGEALGDVALGDTILGDAALGACLTGVFLVGVFLVGVFLPTPPLGATAFALGVVAARVDLMEVSSRPRLVHIASHPHAHLVRCKPPSPRLFFFFFCFKPLTTAHV